MNKRSACLALLALICCANGKEDWSRFGESDGAAPSKRGRDDESFSFPSAAEKLRCLEPFWGGRRGSLSRRPAAQGLPFARCCDPLRAVHLRAGLCGERGGERRLSKRRRRRRRGVVLLFSSSGSRLPPGLLHRARGSHLSLPLSLSHASTVPRYISSQPTKKNSAPLRQRPVRRRRRRRRVRDKRREEGER